MTHMTTNSILAIDLAARPKMSTAAPTIPPEPELRMPMVRGAMVGRFLLNLPRAVWMALDIALVFGGTMLGHNLFVWWVPPADPMADYSLWLAGIIMAPAVVIAGSMFGLYEANTLWSRSRIVARCMLTVIVAMATTWLIMHLFMYSHLSRRAAATGIICFLFSGSVIRLLAHHAVSEVRRGLLVLGHGPLTGTIIRSVRRGAVPGYRLVGVVVSDLNETQNGGNSDIPVVGQIDDIEALCRRHEVAEVVVAESAARNPQHLRAALACLRLGCRVTDETTFYETTYGDVPVSHITPNWFLAADLKGQCQEHAVFKRMLDFVAAGLGLILTAPLFLVIALIIWLRDRGPAFYCQTRVGQSGQHFTVYKFRTMHRDAEADGSAWALPDDPRVTPFGRILRKTHLDELPQLWNIVKGEMSLVGPRPERPEFVAPLSSLIPFYDERHLLKPGLTGWAQINYPYGSTIADARSKLQLDLYYLKHTSLELDLIILLRTLGALCLGSRQIKRR